MVNSPTFTAFHGPTSVAVHDDFGAQEELRGGEIRWALDLTQHLATTSGLPSASDGPNNRSGFDRGENPIDNGINMDQPPFSTAVFPFFDIVK